MARLQEHEGKALFKIAKMPIPQGDVAKSPEEARKIAGEFIFGRTDYGRERAAP